MDAEGERSIPIPLAGAEEPYCRFVSDFKKTNLVLLAGTETDAPVLAIIATSCQNCHSTNTVWPLV